MNDDEFDEPQFDMQLEVEGLSNEEMHRRAAKVRAAADAHRLPLQRVIDFSLRVYVALHQSPILSYEEADARFAAWCHGAEISPHQMELEIIGILQRAQREPK